MRGCTAVTLLGRSCGGRVPSRVRCPFMAALHISDSAEQRTAETHALEALGKKLGVELLPRRLQLPDGSCVEIDGGTDGPPPVMAEVYAHQGRLKGNQPDKLLADAFKLVAARKLAFPCGHARILLVLTDDDAARGLRSGWRKAALAAMEVEVHVVALPAEIAASVREAQKRQEMVNNVK
jgi:hypothetical protein